jgi:hypothetical protein
MSMADFYSHRARAFLIADPDADPELISFVQDLLATGGTGVPSYQMHQGTQQVYEEQLRVYIGLLQTDVVILLRTERQPSREVLTALRIARAAEKPVQALVMEGITAGIEVDELHVIKADPNDQSWPGLQDLRSWAIDFPKRYGHSIR